MSLDLIWAGDRTTKFSREDIGNKGFNLNTLYLMQEKLGIIVPKFFIIPKQFYRDYVNKHKLEEIISVNSVEDIYKLGKSDRGFLMCPSMVPEAISDLFLQFAKDYEDTLLPAVKQLTGVKKFQDFYTIMSEKYPEFIGELKQFITIDDYNKLVEKHALRDVNLKQEALQLKILGDKIKNNLIYRSTSSIEDGKHPAAGVFKSTNNNKPHLLDDIGLAYVLSSPYSAYAQYYMDHIDIILNREMPVMIQEKIGRKRFSGEIHIGEDNEGVIIKYSRGICGFSEFFVKVEQNKIVRYDNKDKIETREKVPFGINEELVEVLIDKIPEEELLNLAKLGKDIKKEVKFKECSLEFILGDDLQKYIIQLNSFALKSANTYIPRILPKIDKSRIIVDNARGFIPGDYKGPFVNLVKYSLSENKYMWGDFKNIYVEGLQSLDKKFPGAIYLVNPYQFFDNIFENNTSKEESDKLFYMLTSRKKGLIIYNADETWDHLGTLYSAENVFTCQVDDFNFTSPLLQVPDGTPINIADNGCNAIIYE